MNYQFSLNLTVRDYECDLQGIVNNAVYLNYLEHTRHQFLLGHNIDFAKLHREGIDLIVSRIEIDYKQSLTSGDEFVVGLNARQEGFLSRSGYLPLLDDVPGASGGCSLDTGTFGARGSREPGGGRSGYEERCPGGAGTHVTRAVGMDPVARLGQSSLVSNSCRDPRTPVIGVRCSFPGGL